MLKRMFTTAVDFLAARCADQISRQMVQSIYARELHPGTLLRRRAQEEASAYVMERMPQALCFYDREKLMKFAVRKASLPGLYLEFGVASGQSIKWISRLTQATVHGFDSFEGLPEDWPGWQYGKGGFSQGGRLPKVRANVQLHAGWFDQTLPAFLSTTPGDCAFLHVD